MNKRHFLALLIVVLTQPIQGQSFSLLVEAESFENKGGWYIDQQAMDVMGSPYLITYGMGQPVADASNNVIFPEGGTYYVYVRTRNWTGLWTDKAAGIFQIKINKTTTPIRLSSREIASSRWWQSI